jgi:hypothetical protein
MMIRIPRAALIALGGVAIAGIAVAAALVLTGGGGEESECGSTLGGDRSNATILPRFRPAPRTIPTHHLDDRGGGRCAQRGALAEELMGKVADEWGTALATGDDPYCELETPRYEDLCKDVLATGTASSPDRLFEPERRRDRLLGDSKDLVTLSDGCQFRSATSATATGASNSGAKLARECERGPGADLEATSAQTESQRWPSERHQRNICGAGALLDCVGRLSLPEH